MVVSIVMSRVDISGHKRRRVGWLVTGDGSCHDTFRNEDGDGCRRRGLGTGILLHQCHHRHSQQVRLSYLQGVGRQQQFGGIVARGDEGRIRAGGSQKLHCP